MKFVACLTASKGPSAAKKYKAALVLDSSHDRWKSLWKVFTSGSGTEFWHLCASF